MGCVMNVQQIVIAAHVIYRVTFVNMDSLSKTESAMNVQRIVTVVRVTYYVRVVNLISGDVYVRIVVICVPERVP